MFYIFSQPADLHWQAVPFMLFSGALFSLCSAMYLNMGLQGLARSLNVPPSQLMLVVAPCTQIWPLLLSLQPAIHDPRLAFTNVSSTNIFYIYGLLGLGLAVHKPTSVVSRKALAVPALLAAFGSIVLPLLKFSIHDLQPVFGLAMFVIFAVLAAWSLLPLGRAWRDASNAAHQTHEPVTGKSTTNLKHSASLTYFGACSAFAASLLLSNGVEALVQWNPASQRWSYPIAFLATQAPAIMIIWTLARRGEVPAVTAYALGNIITWATVGYGTALMAAYRQADYKVPLGQALWASLSGNAIILLNLANARYARAIGVVFLGLMAFLASTGGWKPPKHFVVK